MPRALAVIALGCALACASCNGGGAKQSATELHQYLSRVRAQRSSLASAVKRERLDWTAEANPRPTVAQSAGIYRALVEAVGLFDRRLATDRVPSTLIADHAALRRAAFAQQAALTAEIARLPRLRSWLRRFPTLAPLRLALTRWLSAVTRLFRARGTSPPTWISSAQGSLDR